MGGKVGLTFHLERPAKQFHKQELTFFAWRGSFQYKRHQDKTEPDSTQKMTICYLGCNFLIWTWVKNFSFPNAYLKMRLTAHNSNEFQLRYKSILEWKFLDADPKSNFELKWNWWNTILILKIVH